MESLDTLVRMAREAAHHAYVPYSNFPVGAALLADNGKIYTGCNVENAAYGLTLCAERNAITTAVADGARRISVIAVSAGTTNHITPCGSCRQVISEFSDSSTRILCLNRDGDVRTFTVAELLPEGFVLDSGEK